MVWTDIKILQGEEATEAAGEEFAQRLQPGDVVTLHGDLGAGKTTFCRGICRRLGFTGGVHSPTYSLVHEYPNDPPIYHIDLYRLPPGADLYEIGVDYYGFHQGITLVEWPERLGENTVDIHWIVSLTYQGENARLLRYGKGKALGQE